MVSTINNVNAQIAKCENILNNPNIPDEKKCEIKEMLEHLNLLKNDLEPASNSVNNKYNPTSDQFSLSQKTNDEQQFQPKNVADSLLLMTNPLAYAIVKKGGDGNSQPQNAADRLLLMTNPLAYAVMKNVNPFS